MYHTNQSPGEPSCASARVNMIMPSHSNVLGMCVCEVRVTYQFCFCVGPTTFAPLEAKRRAYSLPRPVVTRGSTHVKVSAHTQYCKLKWS